MIIPITLSTDTSNIKLPTALAQISHDEIILIELQGALDVGNSQPAERNGKFVGKLSIDDDGLKKPTLLIGHHLLEGKVASIPKPLAILHRINATAKNPDTQRKDVVADEESMDVDQGGFKDQGDSDGLSQVPPQWTIVGVVKKKIIFAKRPTPVLKRA